MTSLAPQASAPKRTAENGTVFEAGQANRGRVDDRDHLLGVVLHDSVEQGLVAILQRGEEDVLLEGVVLAAHVGEHAGDLFVEGENARGQQAAQAEGVTFALGERGAFVEKRVSQERGAPLPNRTAD